MFEALGGPCLRSKPRIGGYILGLRCKSKHKLVLIKSKTKPAEDQDDPPVIYLCVRTKFNILWRKITKSSTYPPQCLILKKNSIRYVKKQENMVNRRKKSIEADPEMSQALKLADKGLQHIINTLKNIWKMMVRMS